MAPPNATRPGAAPALRGLVRRRGAARAARPGARLTECARRGTRRTARKRLRPKGTRYSCGHPAPQGAARGGRLRQAAGARRMQAVLCKRSHTQKAASLQARQVPNAGERRGACSRLLSKSRCRAQGARRAWLTESDVAPRTATSRALVGGRLTCRLKRADSGPVPLPPPPPPCSCAGAASSACGARAAASTGGRSAARTSRCAACAAGVHLSPLRHQGRPVAGPA